VYNIAAIEKELKKRLQYQYRWTQIQTNKADNKTNFIYDTSTFETLLEKIKHFNIDLKNYTLNRWYNFWHAIAVEQIFSNNQNVKKEKNNSHKTIDFYINNIPFDHKSTVIPKVLENKFDILKNHKKALISWLYRNQSTQQRQHFKNKLFIVFCSQDGTHWKLKAELSLIKNLIGKYLNSFNTNTLVELNFKNQKIKSDIIWITA